MSQPESSYDLVAIGESMVMFTPEPGVALIQADAVSVHVGGAESNVATYLAELGYRAQWASMVGDDPFGHIITRRLRQAGVDVTAAEVVPGARTGVYVKDTVEGDTTVYYFRHQSAASALSPDFLQRAPIARSRIIHLTGVTAALSDSALAMLRAIFKGRPGPERTMITFDVNYRPALWPIERAAVVLAELANQSDVAFVGLDEAAMLWGCTSAEAVRTVLPRAGRVVVKDGSVGAYTMTDASSTFEPSLSVQVVEPVGAGDAFAAGYLAAALEGCAENERLRMGHLIAAAALTVTSDHAPLPPRAELLRQRAVDPAGWAELRIQPARPTPGGQNGLARSGART